MLRTGSFLAALLALAPPLSAQRTVRLFDGKTLQGWRVAARPEDRARNFWTVREGLITCDSRRRPQHDYVWLMTEREFDDFELTLEVRSFSGDRGNSGIQVRSRYDEQACWLDGPQVDIHPPAPWRSGLIYDETRGVRRWIFPSLPDSRIAPEQGPRQWRWRHAGESGGWNQLRVRCQGTRIATVVNGVTITDHDFAGLLDDANHKARNVGLRGHIALQLHVRDELYIQYRNLRLRPLR